MSTTQHFESVTKTRKPRTSRKATMVEDATIVNDAPHGAPPRERDIYDDLADQLRASTSVWKRDLVAAVLGITAGASLGYVGGKLTMYMTLGALLSGSMFLSSLILVLGIIVTLIAASTIGQRAAVYVASKRIDAHFNAARNWVTGKLSDAGAWIEEQRASLREAM